MFFRAKIVEVWKLVGKVGAYSCIISLIERSYELSRAVRTARRWYRETGEDYFVVRQPFKYMNDDVVLREVVTGKDEI